MKTEADYVSELMVTDSEREYLLRRYAQERELASTATDSRTAVIHASMAAEYERRIADMVRQALFASAESTAPACGSSSS